MCSIRVKLRRIDFLDVREGKYISLGEKLRVEALEMENQLIVCKKEIYLWQFLNYVAINATFDMKCMPYWSAGSGNE